jgi:alkylation response protein AidB-like acyl-CoA dehydrogenase
MIAFSDEQSILRTALCTYLADKHPFDRRRNATAREEGWPESFRRGLGDDLGLWGVALPEEVGGQGGGAIELSIVMEEFGRALVTEPVLETLVVGAGLVKRLPAGPAASLGSDLVNDRVRLALAHAEPQARYTWNDVVTRATRAPGGYRLDGHKSVVIGASTATHYVVSARTSGEQRDKVGVTLFLVPTAASGVSRRDYRTIDGAMAAEVRFDGVLVSQEGVLSTADQGYPMLEGLIDEATIAVCAEACSVLRRMLDDTVAYTKERRQFGKPLSSFQALQHRMVDMLVQLEQAVAITWMATESLSRAGEQDTVRARYVSAAKAFVGKACKFVGQNAVQLHGGMGITEELPIGHYFKRATVIECQYGSTDHHLARYQQLSFTTGAA